MAEQRSTLMKLIDPQPGMAGNILSLKDAGTKLDNKIGFLGILDHAHRMVPAMVGGLMAKRVYNWGVSTFKKKEEKAFYRVANNDEGAGSLALWLLTYLLLKFLPGNTTERLCCGMIGRGSIVIWNTLSRWAGKEDWVRANETSDAGMRDAIDITPKIVEAQLANAPPTAEQLDEELLREVGGLALKSPDFRSKVSDGLARRLNSYLESQGRKTVDNDVVHENVVDLFRSMANR